MAVKGVYDGALQMFIEPPQEVSQEWLGFLVWLKDHGHFEDDLHALDLTNQES